MVLPLQIPDPGQPAQPSLGEESPLSVLRPGSLATWVTLGEDSWWDLVTHAGVVFLPDTGKTVVLYVGCTLEITGKLKNTNAWVLSPETLN